MNENPDGSDAQASGSEAILRTKEMINDEKEALQEAGLYPGGQSSRYMVVPGEEQKNKETV